jgi:hypothetical protein
VPRHRKPSVIGRGDADARSVGSHLDFSAVSWR